ncbi:MAG: polyphosphate kinase 2 family protein [Spirochaetia bacterium]|jgi:PPK2 family polyphosphate:nucleotide phosphotransferase
MDAKLVAPGSKVRLREWDPDDTAGVPGGKEEASAAMAALTEKLDALQEALYAEHRRKVLLILQAMDTAGKDGTIRRVFEGVNPQGVRVASFKAPTPPELDHDYLWRAHRQVPGRGELAIFNRSYYEDVLIVRVHKMVPREAWERRFAQINDFERMLTEEGTTLLKFFLHIDQKEQKKRLQQRLDDPVKRWKFSPDDLAERKLWDEYMTAYEEAISRTSTAWAPWRIIASNHPWYRNLMVARTIVETLEGLDIRYPDPPKGLDKVRID